MPLKVYYLDDEVELCENFAELFTDDYIFVTTFSNVKEFLLMTQEFPPDLAFLDYRLFNITGDAVASELPATLPKYLITGNFNLKTKSNFIEVLHKPFDTQKISAILDLYSRIKRKK